MKITNITDNEICTGCTACYAACPVDAISMSTDERGFYRPRIQRDMCISCGRCAKVCPQLREREASGHSDSYACYAKNSDVQLHSASGGFFYLLAANVIDQGGIVYGAAFDDTMTVKHFSAETTDELNRLRGSKYVQSDLGNCFEEIKGWLKKDRIVLFSGTPCQVAGLLSFLGEKRKTLLTVDIVCHGTPSGQVWKDYLCETFKGEIVRRVEFRHKTEKAEYFPLRFETDKRVVTQKYEKNIFIRGFIKNLYLKEACYHCQYKGIQRESDITIGDCWGIEQVNQTYFNKLGTSLVIVHTNNGRKAFRSISDGLNMIELQDNDLATVIKSNPCIIQPVDKPLAAVQFWEDYQSRGVVQTVKTLTSKPISWYIKQYYMRAKYEVKYHIYLVLKPFLRGGNNK